MIGIGNSRIDGKESAIFCHETAYVDAGLADLFILDVKLHNNLFPNFKEEINVSF